jgi:Rieske Fe-S protein
MSIEETARGPLAKTESGKVIRAKAIVAATNAPIANRLSVHTKQVPYRTYVLTLEMSRGADFDSLIWDTEDPYHYVRAHRNGNESLLIVGGEDHKSGAVNDGDERLKRLETWARRHFPHLGKVRHAWSGQIYEPADYLPFIGRSPGHKNVYLVTGDSGEGLTTGVAASLILPDLIAGRRNAWAAVYRPSRKIKPSSAAAYVKDLAGAARHLIAHVLQSETDPKDIPRNGGAIITVKSEKIAAYRDARGKLHKRSAACTHVGCVVRWNSFERCWDCPCHGSQFAPSGEVLQGPAMTALAEVAARRR